MRYFILICAIFASSNAIRVKDIRTQKDVRAFEGVITDAINCVAHALQNGIEGTIVPKLDPLDVEHGSYKITNSFINGLVSIENLHASQFSEVSINHLKGSIGIFPPAFTLDFAIAFPKVVLKSKYNIGLKVIGEPIEGEGDVHFEAENFELRGNARVTLIGQKLDRFTIQLSLGSSYLDLTGFMHDEDRSKQVSDWVTNELPGWVKENEEKISQVIQDLVLNNVKTYQMEHKNADVEEALLASISSVGDYISIIIDHCNPL